MELTLLLPREVEEATELEAEEITKEVIMDH